MPHPMTRKPSPIQKTDCSQKDSEYLNLPYSLPHRSEIDGLRAIAVLSVVLFHANLGPPGGYTGVDIFFVISGFLITSILRKEMQKETFSILGYWERRIRRILPALLFVILTSLAIGYTVMLPKDFVGLAESAFYQSILGANIYFWQDTGYFAGPSELKPLLHTWSLSVEEQFYLIFPTALLLLEKHAKKHVIRILSFACAVSMGLSIVGSYLYPSATFYLLPTRAWELLIGCLLAFFTFEKLGAKTRTAASILGVALIGIGFTFLTKQSRFPGLNALLPVLGTALVIAAEGQTQTIVGIALSTRLPMSIGKISYSLYLWHWPLFSFFRYTFDESPSQANSLWLLTLTVIVAILSYLFIESPFRQKQTSKTRALTLSFAFIGILAVLLPSSYIVYTSGLPNRLALETRHSNLVQRAQEGLFQTEDGAFPIIGNTATAPSFIVWGDSHANGTIFLMNEIAKLHGLSGLNAANGGNPPIPGCKISWNTDLPKWNNRVLREIESKSIKNIFLIARWASYSEGASKYDETLGIFQDLPLLYEQQNPKDRVLSRNLQQRKLKNLLEFLISKQCNVYVILQAPELNFDPVRREFVNSRFGFRLAPDKGHTTKEEHHERNKVFTSFLKSLDLGPRLKVIDNSGRLFTNDGYSITRKENSLLYTDHHHLSQDGVRLFLQDTLEAIFHSLKQ
jgi:peptidoglycan/LPS O-acetylase OafA/YrhL